MSLSLTVGNYYFLYVCTYWWREKTEAWLLKEDKCGCPIPEGIQGQAGCGSEQPGLVDGDPAQSRGVETSWSLWSFSTQAILWFYDSMILWFYDSMILWFYDSMILWFCDSMILWLLIEDWLSSLSFSMINMSLWISIETSLQLFG